MEALKNLFTIELYRGDTYENFLKCAQICPSTKGSQIFLDRSREQKYKYKETYASRRGIADAFVFALRSARELDHTPIVISGKLTILSRHILSSFKSGFCVVLPEGISLPIDRIWLPKSDFNWKELNIGWLPSWLQKDIEVLDHLELFDPSDFL